MDENNETVKMEDFIATSSNTSINDSQDAERNKCIHTIVQNWMQIILDDDTEKSFCIRTLEDLLVLSYYCLLQSVTNAAPEQHSTELMCKSLL